MFRRCPKHIDDAADIYGMLVNSSLVATILFMVIPVGYAVLLSCIGINPNADKVEIYVRNISSIVAIFITGLFFNFFWEAHQLTHTEYMKFLKPVTVAMGIAAIIKVLISIYYLIYCFLNGNIVLLFYAGEILVWSALAVFAFCYYKRLNV